MSKLLDIPFGVFVEVLDIDHFLYQKIHKKITILDKVFSFFSRASIMVELNLLSTLWYFINV